MPEVIGALGFGEGVERFADLQLQAVDRSLGGTSDQGFEFGERVFDRVQVRVSRVADSRAGRRLCGECRERRRLCGQADCP